MTLSSHGQHRESQVATARSSPSLGRAGALHPDPSPPLSHALVTSWQRSLGEGLREQCECPCGIGHVSNRCPFLCSADASTSHSCGCILGLPQMLRQPWVCLAPTELQKMLSRKKGCVGRQEGWGCLRPGETARTSEGPSGAGTGVHV